MLEKAWFQRDLRLICCPIFGTLCTNGLYNLQETPIFRVLKLVGYISSSMHSTIGGWFRGRPKDAHNRLSADRGSRAPGRRWDCSGLEQLLRRWSPDHHQPRWSCQVATEGTSGRQVAVLDRVFSKKLVISCQTCCYECWLIWVEWFK